MKLRKYYSISRAAMQGSLAYRRSLLIGVMGNVFSIVSLYFVWKAIFAGKGDVNGYSWSDMKVYLLITFATTTMLSWGSESAIAKKILDGSVAMDLLKPVDYKTARLFETIGSGAIECALVFIFGSVIIAAFAGICAPKDLATAALFAFSIIASAATKFQIVFLSSIFCFWTSGYLGVLRTRAAITSLFSGALIPLNFLPKRIERVCLAMPFQGIVQLPVSIYLGRIRGAEAYRALLAQTLWILALWLLGKVVWKRAVRKVTIFGG